MYPEPPKPARMFIEWLCSDGQFRDIPGDLHEEYIDYHQSKGAFRARFRYIISVFRLIQMFILRDRFKRTPFWFSYKLWRDSIKTGYRSLIKAPLVIGATIGLALGFACCLLIFSFISTELSFDKYHAKSDRIYRLIAQLTLGETPNMIASTNTAPAIALKEELSGVEEGTRISSLSRVPVKYEEQKEFYEDRIYFAESSIFKMFNFPMIKGNPKVALSNMSTMVVTESTAYRYFGNEDPIGKLLTVNGNMDYEIVGVVEDVPQNSHFFFDMLLSFNSLYEANGREAIETWLSPFSYYSYVLLDEGQSHDEVEEYLPFLVDKHLTEEYKDAGISVEYYLQSLEDIHLHSNHLRHEIGVHGDIKYLYIFGTIAFFVLIIASLNFVNLITARFSKRVDDIVIRKVLGAEKGVLITGLLIESLVLCSIAMVVAFVIALLLLPVFSEISQRSLNLDFQQHPLLIQVVPGLTLLVGILSGLYPAFFLSSWKASHLIHKPSNSPHRLNLRKVLVILQFAISMVLIICTGLIFRQQQFLMTKDLGFQKERVLVIPITNAEIRNSIETIKEEIKGQPGIVNVAATSHVMGQRRSGGTYKPEGYDQNQTVMMNAMSVDYDFVETMGMELAEGRNFSKDYPSDPENSILINESAAKEIGWESAVGKKIQPPSGEEGKTVIGVVKDFFFKSPHDFVHPTYINFSERPYRALMVKLDAGNLQETIAGIASEWRSFDPNRSMDYYFLDASYDEQYYAEQRMSSVFSYFTLFAVFIACLGLAGMASFVAECRVKEIGIRKVMGASVIQIILMLSKSTVTTLLIAFVIGSPIAYWAIKSWLENFEYRIEIGLDIFLIAAMMAALTALATVVIQSMGVAKSNPVNSLRSE